MTEAAPTEREFADLQRAAAALTRDDLLDNLVRFFKMRMKMRNRRKSRTLNLLFKGCRVRDLFSTIFTFETTQIKQKIKAC